MKRFGFAVSLVTMTLILQATPVRAQLAWDQQESGVRAALRDVSMSAGDIGVIVGNNRTILRTSDGGTSWGSIQSGTTSNRLGCP
ncbi:MAG: hypothetical protein OEV30_00810 [Ignavibacteria bacterium]|nr:hypothetical protein [Ignavibacteria bacterium]